MSQEIFISYRRKDTGGYAGRLYDYLKKQYGTNNVLFDIEVNATVEELRNWVQRVIPESAVVLVLIGEQWIEDKFNRKRLEEVDDIVRYEIELAIENKVPLIPILVDGAPFPNSTNIPESIKKICLYKGYEINNSFWESKLQVLVQAISNVVKVHTPIINRGVEVWNLWRDKNKSMTPNLEGAYLANRDLRSIDLSFANLHGANLTGADLTGANLHAADFSDAILEDAILEEIKADNTIFIHTDLTRANLKRALLNKADFSHANLNGADLTQASLNQCQVFGVSVWNTQLQNARQDDLYLSDPETKNIFSINSIQTAVVIHLLLISGGLRDLIDTISSKSILILGRFTPERKIVLDTLKEEFRKKGYVSLLFDFEAPKTRDITETISIIAHLSRFIIADLTDAKSIMYELSSFVPRLPSVPIVPIYQNPNPAPGVFEMLQHYSWVLKPIIYNDVENIKQNIANLIIAQAETKIEEWNDSRKELNNPLNYDG